MSNRREFIRNLSLAGIAASLSKIDQLELPLDLKKIRREKIWGLLLHLSFNMWEEEDVDSDIPIVKIRKYVPYLNISYELWTDALKKMTDVGLNMVVIDLGNAVKYDSHPEIAVKNAWTTQRLRHELKKIREMGLEPIPKMNFSTGHDTWLRQYSRMVSTEKYYSVCSDLINEVVNLFDTPRFFHIGMDEETSANQKYYDYMVVRQNDLWWGDFYFLIGEIQKNGCRPWMWSDEIWHHQEEFIKKMPRSVLQSNWYYKSGFGKEIDHVRAYLELEKYGFDQIPTSSNWGGLDWHSKDGQENTMNMTKFTVGNISEERFYGQLQSSWLPTIEKYRDAIMDSIEQLGKSKKWYEENSKI